SIDKVAAPDNLEVKGELIRVNTTFENITNDGYSPPLDGWVLVDSAGDRYSLNLSATMAVGTYAFGASIGPHDSADRAMVFDVSPNAGSTFILESTKDPTFRVELTFVARG